ncbi:MAG: hypothetical protein IPN94_23175 [Sphingobacteriales bacterium]|nr:hypothetical protein [Sphingobacteriales bacterium]
MTWHTGYIGIIVVFDAISLPAKEALTAGTRVGVAAAFEKKADKAKPDAMFFLEGFVFCVGSLFGQTTSLG